MIPMGPDHHRRGPRHQSRGSAAVGWPLLPPAIYLEFR